MTQIRLCMLMGIKLLLNLETAERPKGSNSGEIVTRLLVMASSKAGQPWCASTWTALRKIAYAVCGKPLPFPGSASTGAIVRAATKAGMLTDSPRGGDAACYLFLPGEKRVYNSDYKHLETVNTPPDENGDYTTIGGNVGDKVQLVKRNLKRHPAMFVRVE